VRRRRDRTVELDCANSLTLERMPLLRLHLLRHGQTNASRGNLQRAGYSIGTGTGYNPGGFVFYNYGITGSGTGPRSAQRTIDAQVSYGPIAQ